MVNVPYSATLKNIFIQLPCQAAVTTSTDLWQSQEKKEHFLSSVVCEKGISNWLGEHLWFFNSRKIRVCGKGPLPEDCTLEKWRLQHQTEHAGAEG